MTAELPKVIWTGVDPNEGRPARIVLTAVDDDGDGGQWPRMSCEVLGRDAAGGGRWDGVDTESQDEDERSLALCLMDIAIADLSGVKWRETSGDG